MEELISLLRTGHTTCVLRQGDHIYQETSNGILPLLTFVEEGKLKHSCVADKVIGKAAAMVMVYGGVKEVFALTISEHAYQYLVAHQIPVTFETKVPYIVNRHQTGMCPMEETVLHMEDEEAAYTILREKVKNMKKNVV